MGVDIQTYRARIGTYSYSTGGDVVTVANQVNIRDGIKSIGCLIFIGILLVMAGIELNPGPREKESSKLLEQINLPDVKIFGLNENINKEMLEIFFELEEKHGGGKIKNIVIDSNTKCATLTFTEKNDFDAFVNSKPSCILGNEVTVEIIDTRHIDTNVESRRIKISGLMEHINKEMLELFFEKEQRAGGGKVKFIDIDNKNKCVFVEFEEKSGVQWIMKNTPLSIFGMKVHIEIVETDIEDQKMIKITKLPAFINRELLKLFFEHKTDCSGNVVELTVNSDENYAIVEFDESEAVSRILAKRPLTIFEYEVDVDIFILQPLKILEPLKIPRVRITGFKEYVNKEMLETFFQNEERHGGGKVKYIDIDSRNASVTIDFYEKSGIDAFMKRTPKSIFGMKVTIEVIGDIVHSEESRMIKITKFPAHINCAMLKMFFESKRNYVGNVLDVTVDTEHQFAIVEFDNPTAVSKVMDKKPLTIFEYEVDVDVCDMSKVLEPTDIPKLKISGLVENVTVEMLEMFFEMFFANEERTDIGKVKTIEMDSRNKCVVIEFEDVTAVDSFMQKKPKSILGMDVTLEVINDKFSSETNSAGRRMQMEESLQSTVPDTSLVVEPQEIQHTHSSGQMKKTNKAMLSIYSEHGENKRGGNVKDTEMDQKGEFATIDFDEETVPDTSLDVEPQEIQHTHMSGQTEKTNKAMLAIYSEHGENKSGGNVKDSEMNQEGEFGTIDIDEETGSDTLPEEPKMIKISNGSVHMNSVVVKRFLEKTIEYDGNVVAVTVNSEERFAIVTFDSSAAVYEIMEKRPLRILGFETDVDVYRDKVTSQTEHAESGTHRAASLQTTETGHTRFGENEHDSSQEYGDKVTSQTEHAESGIQAAASLQTTETGRTRFGEKVQDSPQEYGEKINSEHAGRGIQKAESSQTTGSDATDSLNIDHYVVKSELVPPKEKCLFQSDNSEKTTAEDNIQNSEQLQTQGYDELYSSNFFEMLEILGLTHKYPGKITTRDILTVNPNDNNEQEKEHISISDIPWLVLRRLICSNSECRDITAPNESIFDGIFQSDNAVSFISLQHDDKHDVSPLDIFFIIFQCCDPFLKQMCVQKLYLCKLAVPFMFTFCEPMKKQRSVLSVWPLRSLAIENRRIDKADEQWQQNNILDLPTNMIAFGRLGRPRYSKSKLINSILSNEGCKTFFNIDCPSGMTQKLISNGHIEMFWLPTNGDKKDRFQEAMTFINLRGDMEQHFDKDIVKFIANFVDAVILIIDVDTILEKRKFVEDMLKNLPSVILIFANPLTQDTFKIIQSFQNDVLLCNPEIHLRVLSTHKGSIEQNIVEMASSISVHISIHIKAKCPKSYQTRFSKSKTANIRTDEETDNCRLGNLESMKMINQMKNDGCSSSWKQILTPIQSNFSKKLGQLFKMREREKDFEEGNTFDAEIKKVRQNQTKSISKTVKLFVRILTAHRDDLYLLKYFLCWLHFYIETEKRQTLPQLMLINRQAWRQLKLLKSHEKQNMAAIKNQEQLISELEERIDEASFSVDHFFREIGIINETFLELREDCTKFGLPSLNQMSSAVGRLVADGHQLELIDGESFYMPYKWIKAVVKEVDKFIGAGKVLALSVLGLQSSGKSTFLNTMFGCNFSTRTGRCTRGIHAQLIAADTGKFKDKSSNYDFILVVDTEGLRSPEMSNIQNEHDNELATTITGIGDITMINIMGENTSEIRDILQVIVHAFLRLKMANKDLDIKKSCSFIHQNVADTSASENMISGLSKLIQTLDEMTKESARSEGILNVVSFSQVIEFDINAQVWYLKNLWQGNPPMARVNTEYSRRVVDVRSSVLKKALKMENKIYKTLDDITEHAHNIWKGVLNEDFVFPFRNSIEIKAYMAMEHVVHNQLWRLESLIRDKLIKISQKSFANCDQEENLYTVGNALFKDINTLLLEEKAKAEEVINKYFENDKYKDIIVQWQTSQKSNFDFQCQQLEQTVKEQIQKDLEKREIEILTVTCHEKHEEELRKMSMKVANEYKGQTFSNDNKNELFNKIWLSFVKKVNTSSSNAEKNRKPMRDIFHTCLINIFQKNSQVIRNVLKHSKNLTPLPNFIILKGSFQYTGIDDKDINFKWYQKGMHKVFGGTHVMSYIETKVNQVFETIDFKIQQYCQVREEITEMSVNKLMHDLASNVNDILKGDIEYKFQKPFYAKIYVHVSRHAHSVFEKHNENYFKTYGAAACLEKYRVQQKISFEAHLSCRRSEDTLSKLFVNIIESFAEEWTLQALPNKVTDELYANLPPVKNRVIIEICTDLLEQSIFEDFIKYIQAPKEYARLWITQKANDRLFAQESKLYSKLSTLLVQNVFLEVNTSVRKVFKELEKQSSLPVDQWVKSFQTFMKASDFSISTDRFRSMKNETEYIRNLEFFTNKILDSLNKIEKNVIYRLNEVDGNSVQWSHSSPIERLIQKIWGCSEQCAFCGEPCAKNEDHKGSEHNCVQHRPLCCIGIRALDTVLATLPSCEFHIQSDQTHTCGVFGYQCNFDERKECDKATHRYKDYKTFLKEWYIAPSADMHDTSKYWMWFVANYEEKLHKYYGYEFKDIPESWFEITATQALQSLSEIYSA